VKIGEEWDIAEGSAGEQIMADDGAHYCMYAPRARRLVLLWNLFLNIKDSDIKTLTARDIKGLISERKATSGKHR
jgi:hypothetical protein